MKGLILAAVAALMVCAGLAAQAQDVGARTVRYYNGARLTLDPTVTIRDEDARWTMSAAQLGKLAVLQGGAASNDFWIVATVTLTNSGGTTNGQTITVNQDARTWSTNGTSATTIATNSTFYGSATNLFNAVSTNRFAGLALAMSGTNGVTLATGTNGALSISVSAGWASVALATNGSVTVTATFAPAFSGEPVVMIVGRSNQLAHVIGVTTTNVVFGSAVTNGWFQWLAFGSP